MRSPISSSRSTPSALAIRRSVPNTLMASGIVEPRDVLEQQRRAAGPVRPRVTISVTSRYGSTCALTRRRSPSFSSVRRKSRRSS